MFVLVGLLSLWVWVIALSLVTSGSIRVSLQML